jgi:Ser/Thr protein kinase RdoA (MazF antagonist)
MGFSCPRPIPQLNGDWILPLEDGRFATVISWVEGNPIGAAEKKFPGSITEHCDLYHRLGRLLAELHNATDNIETNDLRRPAWDLNGLLGKTPFWGKFWENPALSASEKKFLIYTRDAAFEYLNNIKEPDFGLIHADALQENVFLDGGILTLIDFDDAGFGYRSYDLGVPMSQHYALKYLNDLITAIRDGYGTLRAAPSFEDIEFFLLLRCLASTGWVAERQSKKNPTQRIYVERALYSAHQWLT